MKCGFGSWNLKASYIIRMLQMYEEDEFVIGNVVDGVVSYLFTVAVVPLTM